MPEVEDSAEEKSVHAVITFRKSVEALKQKCDQINDYEVIVSETENSFRKCDTVLQHIITKREESLVVTEKMNALKRSMEEHVKKFKMLDGISDILVAAEVAVKSLERIESDYLERNFYRLIVNVEQLRLEVETSPYRNTKLFGDIINQTEKWRKVSAERLGACLDQCITITSTDSFVSCAVDQKYLKNLVKEAGYDLLSKVFILFSTQVLSSIIVPILRKAVLSYDVDGDTFVINLEIDDITDCPDRFDTGSESATLKTIPAIISVFKFVKENIFIYVKNRKFYYDLLSDFGSGMISDMSSLLCSIFLRPLLPNRPSKLGSFHALIGQIGEFQDYLEEAGFLSEPSSVLAEFVQSHVNLVLEKYETSLLIQARNILRSRWDSVENVPESHFVIENSTDLDIQLPSRLSSDSLRDVIFSAPTSDMFHLPACEISSFIVKYMKLVRDVFKEIQDFSHHVATERSRSESWHSEVLQFLSSCARHVADMFLAFLPVGSSLMKCGQLKSACIILTDCAYYSSTLLQLEAEFSAIRTDLSQYQNALPLFIFLDMVQPARSQGWSEMRNQLEFSRNQIVQIDLEPWCQGASGKLMATGFRLHSEKSLTVVVSKLAHSIQVLRSVLPHSLASALFGLLLDSVLSKIVSLLVSRTDISEAESRAHFEMLNQFSDEVISNVAVIGASDSPDQPASQIMGKVYLSKICPDSWPRFLDMISLLDSGLESIVDSWADGVGPLANSFAPDEVRTVIRALFQNSDVRQRALKAIK